MKLVVADILKKKGDSPEPSIVGEDQLENKF